MRRILLALPLFLVVGLAFVELPASGTSPASVQTSTNTTSGSAEATPVASDPMGISAPVAVQAVKTKINLNPNSGDLFTKGNHDDEDDEDYEDDEGDDDDDEDEDDED
jgi:hypothetical protein